jgi:putative peptidoglycan lipid II flippase
LQVRIRISRGAQPAESLKVPLPKSRARFGLGASSSVALGILISRLTGLLRVSVFAHYFGASAIADAFNQAVRIPNMLNNLFGEGVLSASFVTVYSKLRAKEMDREAEDLAAAVFGILSVLCAVLVLLGVMLAPLLVDVIAPGFHADKRDLTIRLVRILFPGTGLLVMSAWCLGVLNSHHRFLLSYTAPVAMNAAQIAFLIGFGGHAIQDQLAIDLAWGYVLGSVLQFLVQLPRVLQLLPGFRPTHQAYSDDVTTVFRNFGGVFVGRGVVQLSSFVDSIIASKLPNGAVAAFAYAQNISLLPISLFSMSVSAAELPALSSAVGGPEEVAAFLRNRLSAGLRRIAFFIVPSAVAFLLLGDVISAALYQSGKFRHADAVWQWGILAGSAVGLLASALGRLYSSGFYALLDTKTPLRFAVVRVALTTALGFLFALPLPRWIGIDQKWGVAGLTASAGIAGWVEFTLLRRGLSRRIGKISIPGPFLLKLWGTALCGALAAYPLKLAIGTAHPRPLALVELPLYGIVYLAGTARLGVEESKAAIASVMRRIGR